MTHNPHPDGWAPLPRPWAVQPGDTVQLHRYGSSIREGSVETVMPSGKGFWLAADGAELRQFVDTHDETLVVWG
jgi:hypothetical protein